MIRSLFKNSAYQAWGWCPPVLGWVPPCFGWAPRGVLFTRAPLSGALTHECFSPSIAFFQGVLLMDPEATHNCFLRGDPAGLKRHPRELKVQSTVPTVVAGSSVDCAVSPTARDMATVPLSIGGLGLRSVFRLRHAAHWASWGDCLEMIRDRCPLVFDRMMRSLTSGRAEQPLSIEAARQSAQSLQTAGFEVPRWEDLAEGLRRCATSGGW